MTTTEKSDPNADAPDGDISDWRQVQPVIAADVAKRSDGTWAWSAMVRLDDRCGASVLSVPWTGHLRTREEAVECCRGAIFTWLYVWKANCGDAGVAGTQNGASDPIAVANGTIAPEIA